MKYCPKCRRSYTASQNLCLEDGELLSLKDLYGLTGRVINDRYRIESLVTVGGMSAVYRARQIGVERNVAFKILLPHLALNNQNMHTLFEREARTAGRLTHENIATVHDAGRTSDEISFIVMEWLEGKTLEDEFHETARFSFQRISFLLRPIAAALDAAHAHGVIHRDLKPSNIMIVPRAEGRDLIKVLDFGLAKITNESTELEVSSALGTPHYASPEQFRIGEEISGRSDIYSLGVILYRLLTNQMPFEASSVHELIRAHLLESPPPLRSLRSEAPPEVEYLVNRMLAKTPHYRPANAAEVVEAFEQAIQSLASAVRNNDSLTLNVTNGGSGTHANGQSNGQRSGPSTPPPATTSTTGAGKGTGSLSLSQTGGPGVRATTPLSGDIGEQPVLLPVAPPSGEVGEKPAGPPSGNHNQAVAAQTTHTRGATFVSVNAGGPPAPPLNRATTPLTAAAQIKQPGFAPPASPKAPPLIQMQVTDSRKLILWLVAAALIGGALFYYFYARQPQITAQDTVLLADFANLTGDEVFDKTLKPALALQLAQSPFLNLLPDEKVRETLRFMNRAPDEPLTPDIAREISLRRGIKVVFTGQIDKLEQSYVIALEAVNSQSGEAIARALTQAADKDQILKMLGEAALKLRAQLGESLSSVQKFNAPIELATTSSLEALNAYSRGHEQLNVKANAAEAIPLYRRAIELDPNFAMPYHALATIYLNQGLPRLSADYSRKAFNLRDRVSERERLTISALYHAVVTGDMQQATETYKLMIQTYPNSAQPHTGLAHVYRQTGQLTQALGEAELALELDPHEVAPHLIHAHTLLCLNRFDEAKQKLEQALAQKMDGLGLRAALFQTAFLQNDQELMNQQLAWARAKNYTEQALDWQAQAAAATGQMREAARLWRQALDVVRQRKQKEFSAPYAVSAGVSYALAGQTQEARKFLDEAQALAPDNFAYFSALSALPFGPLAYALCGARDKAQMLITELATNQPQNSLANNVWLPVTKAWLAVQDNQPEQALEALKYVNQYESCARYYANWVRGQAYMQLKRGYDAKGEFQKIIANRGLDAVSLLYPLGHLGVARATALIGDMEESHKHYQNFLALWRNADADLPVLASAKKEFATL